jgi:hypothetical protein
VTTTGGGASRPLTSRFQPRLVRGFLLTSSPDRSKTVRMTRKIILRLRGRSGCSEEAKTFERRYDEAEQRRRAILARLESLNEKARAHPAYKRALTLLNPIFRKATIAQRGAILSSAEWLVDLVESLSMFV